MRRLLVVDDDRTDRTAVRRLLADMDVEIVEVQDAEKALASVEEQVPDLVLTDLRMPGMTGLELVERLGEEMPGLPVVLMTSMGNERLAMEALAVGASSYVPKSELDAMLEDTLRELFELVEARRERQEVLTFLRDSRTEFVLPTDIRVIPPFSGFVTAQLELLGFGHEAERSRVGMAVAEALSNAIVHGNLELGSELRDNDRAEFDRRLRARSEQSPYAEREVRCVASLTPEVAEFRIEDEGPGFDVSRLPDPTEPENLLAARGRGVFLLRTFMDEVEYTPPGNVVTLRKRAS